jgi:hypothetical protein
MGDYRTTAVSNQQEFVDGTSVGRDSRTGTEPIRTEPSNTKAEDHVPSTSVEFN